MGEFIPSPEMSKIFYNKIYLIYDQRYYDSIRSGIVYWIRPWISPHNRWDQKGYWWQIDMGSYGKLVNPKRGFNSNHSPITFLKHHFIRDTRSVSLSHFTFPEQLISPHPISSRFIVFTVLKPSSWIIYIYIYPSSRGIYKDNSAMFWNIKCSRSVQNLFFLRQCFNERIRLHKTWLH